MNKEKAKKQLLGGQGGDINGDDEAYLRSVLETDVSDEYLDFIAPELDRSAAVANRKSAEVEEAVQLLRSRTAEFEYSHPPRGSRLQGEFREAVMGDDRRALSSEEVRVVRALLAVAEARITLGRGFTQQDAITTMKSIMRSEQSVEGGDSGILSKLKGD